MSAADRHGGVDLGRVVAGVIAAAVFVVLAVLLVAELNESDGGGSAAEPDAPGAVAPSAPAVSESASSEAPVAAEPPEESPMGDLEPGTTAFFHGEPATGPWQTIGSVSEITAAGAGPVAALGYEEHWETHGLPDALWDELVARVSLEAVDLGPPLERPVLGGAAGAEALNASAGIQWDNEDTQGRGLVAIFDAIYDHHGLGVWPRWAFLIHPETHEVLAHSERVEVTEDDATDLADATDQLSDEIWRWVLTQPVLEGH